MSQIVLVDAHSPEHLGAIRQLFLEYAYALETDLCFQNFAQELAHLPGSYGPPEGRLLLALNGEQTVGCVALRKMDEHVCEMKRLYLRPAFRRLGAGRLLATAIIGAARQIGYQRMRLDTLASMKAAISLYQSLGFRPIAPYYHNPNAEAVFMELELRRESKNREDL